MVVDGAGGEEDDLGARRFRRGPRVAVGVFELLERRDDALGCLQAYVASGDVVVGGDDVENCPRAADAVCQEVDIVDAALVDLDSLVASHLGDVLNQFGLVATIGVDLCTFCA